MKKLFKVIGGEYRNTSFEKIVDGTYEEYGPMNKIAAIDKWRECSWQHVDQCHYRFTVVPA